ncbi:uncharacterized protein L969DRAFT_100755 [Mixia osmundae IAM 14324]|uniref:Sister chromatid cohesion protein n=1 Tax=Mixia osmundae (strain CBS 9802 / IAM 14324 / JCM 22182 / KY 12970) TaxID=764103 RepID=G7E098_MIXOS|nr:uncharacterized protein L969DRAFT_100755 [Mixia osmundae IAM 14324]KEI42248.1 hypothetical protein L969DRAFT_100755 [Mixia osmundae IAM 14324]GAA96258.1 hypothetical protein E5Q_02922 [Mixia osmundae IAM 14324]
MAGIEQELAKLNFGLALIEPARQDSKRTRTTSGSNSSETNKLTAPELVKRLKELHAELSQLEQGAVEIASLDTVKAELVHASLIVHSKDRGVKAYLACCLADILRLYAPDAPYTADELKLIFQFTFRQLACLKSGATTYHPQYFYLLESFAAVKSIVLVCDLPSADALLITIFEDLFTYTAIDLPAEIRSAIGDILVHLIDEAQTISTDLLTTILSQFEPDRPPAALKTASQVLIKTSDRLQRNVGQYFAELLLNTASTDDAGQSAAFDMDELENAHEVIIAIAQHASPVLLSVIPQLESQLGSRDVKVRTLATHSFARMLAQTSTREDFTRAYPRIWDLWLRRLYDSEPSVRIAALKYLIPVWKAHPFQSTDLDNHLCIKLQEPDDKVRQAALLAFASIDLDMLRHHVQPATFRTLVERVCDKRPILQTLAAKTAANLYVHALPLLEAKDTRATALLGDVPTSLLSVFSTVDRGLMNTIRSIFLSTILKLPEQSDELSGWLQRFIFICSGLPDAQLGLLVVLGNLREHRPNEMDSYLRFAAKYNGGVMDKNEDKIAAGLHSYIKKLSAGFVDSAKAVADLQRLAKLNDARLFKLLAACVDVDATLKGLHEAKRALDLRLREKIPEVHDTVNGLYERYALHFINRSTIKALVDAAALNAGADTAADKTLARILAHVSKAKPQLCKDSVSALGMIITTGAPKCLVNPAMRITTALIASDDLESTFDSAATTAAKERLLVLVPNDAKITARFLAVTSPAEDSKALQNALLDSSQDRPTSSRLASLTGLAKADPKIFDGAVSRTALDLALTTISRAATAGSPDDLTAGYWALKLLKRLLAVKDLAEEVFLGSIAACTSVLETADQVCDASVEEARAEMRLASAKALLRLLRLPRRSAGRFGAFERLAWTIQDPVFSVRNRFLIAVIKGLLQRRLPVTEFGVILFLTAHDPEAENIQNANAGISRLIAANAADVGNPEVEMALVRLLHMLAHHPDYAATPEGLLLSQKYIDFFIESVATSTNASLLYYLAAKCKTVQDQHDASTTESIYVLAELTQYRLKQHASSRSWVLSEFPGRMRMPGDIYKPLHSKAESHRVANTQYLSAELLDGLERLPDATRASAKSAAPREGSAKPAAKRKAPATGKPRAKARAKKRRPSYELSDSENEAGASDSGAELESDYI